MFSLREALRDEIAGDANYVRLPLKRAREGTMNVVETDDSRGVKIGKMQQLHRPIAPCQQRHGTIAGLQMFRFIEVRVTQRSGGGKRNAAEKSAA